MSLNSLLFATRESCKRSLCCATTVLNTIKNGNKSSIPMDSVLIRTSVRSCWTSSPFCHELFPGKDGRKHTPGVHLSFWRNLSTQKSIKADAIQQAKANNIKVEDTKQFVSGEELRKIRKKRLLEEPDEVEPHVIYKGLLTGQMRRLKIFSFVTSATGLALQPLLIEKASEVSLVANVAVLGMVGLFTFGTPIMIHLLAKKYITEIIYDPAKDTYTATTYTFFLQKNQMVFKMENTKIPDVPGPFTSITINKGNNQYVPYFIAPESFVKPSHYGRFMGYDKPIDLHLTVQNQTNDGTDSKSGTS